MTTLLCHQGPRLAVIRRVGPPFPYTFKISVETPDIMPCLKKDVVSEMLRAKKVGCQLNFFKSAFSGSYPVNSVFISFYCISLAYISLEGF